MSSRAPSMLGVTRLGRTERFGATFLPRHRHRQAYAAVVLAGGYEEAGDGGRQRLRPGDVLLHAPFEAHLDRFDPAGAVVLNLPWRSWGARNGEARRRFAEVDGLARLARRDLHAAAEWLEEASAPVPRASCGDWPDALASALAVCPALFIGDWARARGLSPATVSRGFRRVFGVSPARFRAECRARAGWRRLVQEPDAPLAVLALDAGFADQAHLCRAVRALTGIAPRKWQRAARVKSVQECG